MRPPALRALLLAGIVVAAGVRAQAPEPDPAAVEKIIRQARNAADGTDDAAGITELAPEYFEWLVRGRKPTQGRHGWKDEGETDSLSYEVPEAHLPAGVDEVEFEVEFYAHEAGIIKSPAVEFEWDGRRYRGARRLIYVLPEMLPGEKARWDLAQNPNDPDEWMLALELREPGRKFEGETKPKLVGAAALPLGLEADEGGASWGDDEYSGEFELKNTSDAPITITQAIFQNLPEGVELPPLVLPPRGAPLASRVAPAPSAPAAPAPETGDVTVLDPPHFTWLARAERPKKNRHGWKNNGATHRVHYEIPEEHLPAGTAEVSVTVRIYIHEPGVIETPAVEFVWGGRRYRGARRLIHVLPEMAKGEKARWELAQNPNSPGEWKLALELREPERRFRGDTNPKLVDSEARPPGLESGSSGASYGKDKYSGKFDLVNTSDQPITLTQTILQNLPEGVALPPLVLPAGAGVEDGAGSSDRSGDLGGAPLFALREIRKQVAEDAGMPSEQRAAILADLDRQIAEREKPTKKGETVAVDSPGRPRVAAPHSEDRTGAADPFAPHDIAVVAPLPARTGPYPATLIPCTGTLYNAMAQCAQALAEEDGPRLRIGHYSSDNAVAWLLRQRGARMAFTSVAMSAAERAKFRELHGRDPIEAVVAQDAVCVITAPDFPLPALDRAALARVWWAAPGGPNPPDMRLRDLGALPEERESWGGLFAIPIGGSTSYGTSRFLRGRLAPGAPWRKDMKTAGSVAHVGGVPRRVARTRGGIGYCSWRAFEQAQQQGLVRGLPISPDGGGAAVAPTLQNVGSGAYPLARPIYCYMNAGSAMEAPEEAGLLDLLLSAQGAELLRAQGNIPLNAAGMQRARKLLQLPAARPAAGGSRRAR